MTIVEFLQARIDEDEAGEARKWLYSDERIAAAFGPCAIEYHSSEKVLIKPYSSDSPVWMDATEFRSAYGDPAPDLRILAECAAKRAIIEQVSDVAWGGYAVRDVILGHLAAVYKDHPDYQEEWAN